MLLNNSTKGVIIKHLVAVESVLCAVQFRFVERGKNTSSTYLLEHK